MAGKKERRHEREENIGEEFVEHYGGPMTATQRRSKKTSDFINHGKV